MTAPSDRVHLAALMRGKDRALLSAFLRDDGTDFGLNPFPSTTAGAARQGCAGLAFEYPILGVHSAGPACLMEALANLPRAERLTRSILKSATPTCIVFLAEDGACVGAYLYGKAGVLLPVFRTSSLDPAPRKRRTHRPAVKQQHGSRQLDLFIDFA